MSQVNNRVVIWGADNHHALGVVRALAGHGLDVTFLVNGGKHDVATASRHCDKYVLTANLDKGYEWLIVNMRPDNRAALIPMGDGPAEYIDQHRSELEKGYILSGTTEQGLLTKIDDKKRMAEVARRHGFNVPATMEITWESKIEALPEGITFPCLIKPSVTTGFAEFKTRIVNSKNELKSAISLFGHQNKYLLQQLIQKNNDLLVYGVRLHNGKVLLAGTFFKDRWSDDGGGSHGWLVPDVMDNCNSKGIESMLEEIDYHGLFSFEYGLQDGTAWFYEVNLRNDATGGGFYILTVISHWHGQLTAWVVMPRLFPTRWTASTMPCMSFWTRSILVVAMCRRMSGIANATRPRHSIITIRTTCAPTR